MYGSRPLRVCNLPREKDRKLLYNPVSGRCVYNTGPTAKSLREQGVPLRPWRGPVTQQPWKRRVKRQPEEEEEDETFMEQRSERPQGLQNQYPRALPYESLGQMKPKKRASMTITKRGSRY